MKSFLNTLFTLVILSSVQFCLAQNNLNLRNKLNQFIQPFNAKVGVSIWHLENNDTLTFNNTTLFPMMSVYKFPLALYVLHQVDKKVLQLDQKIHITKKQMHSDTWSPLQKQYPEGNIDLTLAEMIDYTVSQSDNNTCDILFELVGGTKPVETYIHSIGFNTIFIKTTEADMPKYIDSLEKVDGCYPHDITKLMIEFYKGKLLSSQSNTFLMKCLIESKNSNNRIKALLPPSTIVAHKTGTGNHVVNDAGIITLPNGNHLALTILVQKAEPEYEETEKFIAQIAKVVYEHYTIEPQLNACLDSLFQNDSKHRFSGLVQITCDGKPIYTFCQGKADYKKQLAIEPNDAFIIGSISKQITAVIILRLFDQGKIELTSPIGKYLPNLKQSWKDTVTVHHLLTHMHGISHDNKPLEFKPGSRFDYNLSDQGYRLLSEIAASATGKSFPALCDEVFALCQMKNSYHPGSSKNKQPVKGYMVEKNGKYTLAGKNMNDPAAGGLISTAADLVLWNENLHGDKLLKPSTYRLMTTPQPGAIREHPLFGKTFYGYGITVSNDSVLRLGQTGFATGFACMNFYYPKTKTSMVVLSNTIENTNDLKQIFYFHLKVFNILQMTWL